MKKFLILILVMVTFILSSAQISTNIPKYQNQLFDFTDTVFNDFIYEQAISTEIMSYIYPPGWNEPEYGIWSFSVLSVRITDGRIVIKDSIRNVDYPLKLGDWIGTFCIDLDGSLKCTGANQYVYENLNLGLNLVADNPATPDHKEGFYEDEEIIVKIYRWGIYQDVIADTLSYGYCDDPLVDCDGYFNNGSLYVLDTIVADLPLEEHILYLNNNWSYISSYLKHINMNVEYMFDPVVDNLVILKSLSSQIYWPDQGINTIVNWRYEKAYQLKMNESDTLSLYGIEIDDINLTYPMGWYLVPVPYNNIFNVQDVFSNLYLQPTGIIKTTTLVYWPYYGINTLQYLQPGKGYQAHFDIETTADFGLATDMSIITQKIKTTHPWNYKITPISNIILLKNIDNIFNYGDYIGVFDSEGNCCGYTVYEGGKNIAIISYGDDISTDIKDGLSISEKLNFKLFDGITSNIEPIMSNDLFYVNDITYGHFNSNNIEIFNKENIIIKDFGDRVIINNNQIVYYKVYNSMGQLIHGSISNGDIEIYKLPSVLLVVLYYDDGKTNTIKIK